MPTPKTIHLQTSVTPAKAEEYDRLAEQLDVSRSQLIRDALEAYAELRNIAPFGTFVNRAGGPITFTPPTGSAETSTAKIIADLDYIRWPTGESHPSR